MEEAAEPSAPPLEGVEPAGAGPGPPPARAESLTYVELYQRLEAAAASAAPDTSSDAAIAAALAEAEPGYRRPPDTSLDAALALQLHSDEVDRLCGHKPLGVDDSGDLDSLIRSRLSGSQLLKLVPRLNPFPAPAPSSAGQRERDRLRHRLAFYGLCEKEVLGDGNCQFRALSDQLFRTADHHAMVRARVVAQLAAHPELYAHFVGQPYHQYVDAMARSGTWGDHVTLKAAADAWGIKIFVVTSFLENSVLSIEPAAENPSFARRALHLSFWAEVHYNSIYPANAHSRLAVAGPSFLNGLRNSLNATLRAVLPS